MIRKNKHYLNYNAWFKKIKDYNGVNVATIRGRTIYSSNETFLAYVKSGGANIDCDIHVNRKSYNVIDERTKQLVGLVDDRFNVFNNNNQYSGTIHNLTRIFNYVSRTIITVIIIFLILIIIFLKTTGDSIKPTDIYVTEADGASVEDQWNIFGQTEEEKVIMPGKKGVYYFTIHNTNYFDIECDLSFEELNEWDIALKYRLRRDAFTYLKGNSRVYVEVEDLDVENIIVPARSYITLVLDWYWDEDDSDNKDTIAGIAENAEYTITIEIVSEEKTK